jgi:hypothetical protein
MARAADQSPDFLTRTVIFRGTEYVIRELSIGEFDDITEQATVKRTVRDGDGNETEVDQLDGQLQSRLMMKACVAPSVSAGKIGVRLYGGLNRAIQEMHFSAEPDETKVVKADEAAEETPPGN